MPRGPRAPPRGPGAPRGLQAAKTAARRAPSHATGRCLLQALEGRFRYGVVNWVSQFRLVRWDHGALPLRHVESSVRPMQPELRM